MSDVTACTVCLGRGYLEHDEEGTVDCYKCDGNGTVDQ